MKNKFFLMVLTAGILNLSACKKAEANANTSEKISKVSKIETATFTVSGMSCAVMCATKIQKELADLKGVQKATVDFEKKLATVNYDSALISPEKIIVAVEAVAGGSLYKVSNLKCTANKASLYQEKEKTRKERRAEEKAKKEAKATTEATPTVKGGCCSGKKVCSKDEKVSTI
jgi:periplasmic mercuric ion binding protein